MNFKLLTAVESYCSLLKTKIIQKGTSLEKMPSWHTIRINIKCTHKFNCTPYLSDRFITVAHKTFFPFANIEHNHNFELINLKVKEPGILLH